MHTPPLSEPTLMNARKVDSIWKGNVRAHTLHFFEGSTERTELLGSVYSLSLPSDRTMLTRTRKGWLLLLLYIQMVHPRLSDLLLNDLLNKDTRLCRTITFLSCYSTNTYGECVAGLTSYCRCYTVWTQYVATTAVHLQYQHALSYKGEQAPPFVVSTAVHNQLPEQCGCLSKDPTWVV